ncbi:MAG: DUF6062 family protein [Spirochaetota bacterium]
MKYKLETIPVWDAITSDSSICTFCSLLEDAQRRAVNYYLGSSVMNPETRIKVNSQGFCFFHYSMLAEAGKPQGAALIAHSHLLETRKQLQPVLIKLQSANSRTVKKQITSLQKLLEAREKGCLICDSIQRTLKRYQYTYIHLWSKEQEFRDAAANSSGVCLHHLRTLLDMALEVLNGSELVQFVSWTAANMERWLLDSEQEVHWLTQLFKSEHSGSDWTGFEQSQTRAISREVGRIREDLG